jgi:cytochrome c peroxidase
MRLAVVLALGALAVGCGDNQAAPGAETPMPWAREPLPPVPVPDGNPMTEAKLHLGGLLFHDPILSSDREVACVTCHGQIWGLSDGLPRSVGVGGEGPAGTGREGPNMTRRNSQTLWNTAYRERLFWDGRASSLEDQVRFPIESPVELDRPVPDVVADLAAIPEYVELFAAAFPGEAQPVTAENLARALAAFERTLVSNRSPYDAYLAGDAGALSENQVRGMFLMAEVGCAGCHTPPFFASERFEDVGVPGDPALADEGRFEITGDEADRRKFRVPTLRNLRTSGPYFHDGSEPDLVAACDHGASRPLAADELEAIAEFIEKGLHDESADPPRAVTVPSGLPVPLDGYSIPR